MTDHSDAEPRKAYLVQYKVVNVCEVLIYANSAAEARERFGQGEGGDQPAWTGHDYRIGVPKVRRSPEEDRRA